ncbi:type-4 ice-structuring protein LS-12 [Nothobranchius furzeri]|uniref:Type-4 ice-structuring protein LS-12-like n=7 Tax=Nothobranchius TaxID=28779 RepID=A0A1A8AY56_NOTFU|nr:type-4 ice-structuring protein LS-12 [Nothobranchius furzeri]KAF7226566.1 type-4 ice-structuring protein LS-12-like [Nothobranchius furzeri]
MKFSLVATLLVLAAVYGSEAASLVKRDVQSDVDKFTQLFKDMSISVSAATQEMIEKMKALEMTNAAQTYMEDSRVKIQPLMETVQSEATRLQEQVQPYIINMEEHMKPLTDNLNAQVKPLTDMMEKFFQQVMDQSKTLLPPQ